MDFYAQTATCTGGSFQSGFTVTYKKKQYNVHFSNVLPSFDSNNVIGVDIHVTDMVKLQQAVNVYFDDKHCKDCCNAGKCFFEGFKKGFCYNWNVKLNETKP